MHPHLYSKSQPRPELPRVPKSKFPWILWHYTCAHESLFDLTPNELRMFAQFVALAQDEGHVTA